jgi:2-methylcitrate dehydratase PrpD
MGLVGGDPAAIEVGGPAVPGGLAIKAFPCCYALQRPIAAVQTLEPIPAADVRRIAVRTPAVSLAPLIHHSPATGLEGKFSLEYGIAAALLDRDPGFDSFSDAAVGRPEAMAIGRMVEVAPSDDGGDQLLTGDVELEIETRDGAGMRTALALPPGAPGRPMTDDELGAKLALCGAGELADVTWESAVPLLRSL